MSRIVNKREAMKKAKSCAVALLLRLDNSQYYGDEYYSSLGDLYQEVADKARADVIKRIEKMLR